MKHWIGGAMMLVGAVSAVVGFWLNQNLPDPPGPVPTIGGAILVVIGLLVWSF
jgi:hypothetical protein